MSMASRIIKTGTGLQVSACTVSGTKGPTKYRKISLQGWQTSELFPCLPVNYRTYFCIIQAVA